MRHLISMVLGFSMLLVATLAIAQMEELKNSTPEERATLQTDWMKTNLSLDEKATEAVSAINLKYAKETQALMDSDGTKLGKMMTFRRNSDAKDAEMRALMTPEQYSQYEQKKTQMGEMVKQKIKEKYQASHSGG
jgi:hypothetical protein